MTPTPNSNNHLPETNRQPPTLEAWLLQIAQRKPPLLNKGKCLVSPESPVSFHTRLLQKVS
jgi:hypothetical protein